MTKPESHTNAAPLSKADIAAMRKATSVCFRYNGIFSQIEAKQQAYGEMNETRRDIRVNTRQTVYAYASNSDWGCTYSHELSTAFEMIHSAQHHEAWQTLCALVKPGDVLGLHWEAGGYSHQTGRGVGFVGDQLSVTLTRKNKVYAFIVEWHMGPDNSARMCHIQRKA